MSKYRAIKTVVGGITFDSKAEARRYAELAMMEKAGEIRDLRLQVAFELMPGVKIEGNHRKSPPMRYVADFSYTQVSNGKKIIEDVKGYLTETYKIKRHMMKALFDIDILETK